MSRSISIFTEVSYIMFLQDSHWQSTGIFQTKSSNLHKYWNTK